MDPLSVSASVAGLVTLADLVFRATLKYSKSVKGAPKEVKDLLSEIKDLSLLLHNLSMVAFGLELQPDPQSGATSPKPYHLHECHQLLRRLEDGLPKFEGQSSLEKLQSRLKWPFSTSETKEMLQAISRHKQTINLALAADSINKLQLCLSRQEETGKEMRQLKHEVKKVLDIQTRISLDQKRKDILNTFLKANPRSEFEINKRLRHPMTALWLTESTDFEDWFSTERARIWCSGIPGAGKSVIASAIIDECLQRTQINPSTAVCYFFCTYRDSRTALPCNIWSALCYQLALQNEAAYGLLEAYYDELNSGDQLSAHADGPRLMDVLNQLCATFGRVYVVVDGLDECGAHTQEIVNSLLSFSLATTNTNINFALLSRDEMSIRELIEPHFDWIEIEANTHDIQLYVASEMDRLIRARKLRLKDTTLKDEIMARLVKGAQGMFRWVTCQLDHLCELPTDRARRNALESLPPTLPATYERILLRIDTYSSAVRLLVERSLLLISYQDRFLDSKAFCEAISISDHSDRLDEDEVVDEQEVLRWCGSLVRISPHPVRDGQRFEFAHYTVQEFLQKDCINHSSLSAYGISQTKSNDLFMRLSLRLLTLQNFKSFPQADEKAVQEILSLREHRPFYEPASIFWQIETLVNAEARTLNYLSMLFDIKKTPNFSMWAVEVIRHCLIRYDNDSFHFDIRPDFGRNADIAGQVVCAVLRPDFTPLHMAAAWGLTNVCRLLLDNGAKINLMSRYGTPLQCAVGGLSAFADVGISSTELRSYTFHRLQPLGGLPSERQITVQLLLNAGAQVHSLLHTPFKSSSLLCLAIFSSNYSHDFEIISDLIRSGVVVEEEDLPNFAWTYDFAQEAYEPDDFKKIYDEGHAILRLLEILGHFESPETSQRPEVQLYHMTFQFAKQMELDVPNTLLEPSSIDGLSDEDFGKFVHSAIISNNICVLERLPSRRQCEVVGLLGLDPDKPDWTPVHVAVYEKSLDCLKILLDWGCDANARAADGRTPLHLCRNDKHKECMRALLQHGGNTMVLDNDSGTVWHTSVHPYSVEILKVLIQEEHRDSALQIVDKWGLTPICRALISGWEKSTKLLLEFCKTKQHWKSSGSIYRAAAKLGSSKIVQTLLEVGVDPDGVDEDTGNPLHFLSASSDIECVDQLKTMFSCCQKRNSDLKIPFESLLQRAVQNAETLECDIAVRLLPDSTLANPEDSCAIWSFLCDEVFPVATKTRQWGSWIEDICEVLLQRGIAKSYEEHSGKSMLVPLAASLCQVTPGRLKVVRDEGEGIVCFEGWNWFAKTFLQLAKDTKHKDTVAGGHNMTQLLCEAVIHDDKDMVELLVALGVDCHTKVDMISPFELSCLPNFSNNGEVLGSFLGHKNARKLEQSCSFLEGIGPLHLTAGIHEWDQGGSLDKLHRLLQAGADPNLPSHTDSPIVHHIIRDSIETAEALLDFGADPWLPGRDTCDAALASIFSHNSSFLEKISEHASSLNLTSQWNHTMTGPYNHDTNEGANALHVAALSNEVECLEFYLDQHHLTNIDVQDDQHETPMHYAAREGHVSVVDFLVGRGANINATSASGMTPLHIAVEEKRLGCVRSLLDHGATQQTCHAGWSPFTSAYYTGNFEIISALQTHLGSSPADVLATNHKSVRKMAETLRQAIRRNDLDACKRIHALGCPVDVEIYDKMTPLVFAIRELGSNGLVQWFLDNDAKASMLFWDRLQNGYITAVHVALRHWFANPILAPLVTKYLDEGGDFPVHQQNPLVSAIEYRNTEGLLTILGVLKNNSESINLPSLLNQPSLRDQGMNRYDSLKPLHAAATYDDLVACRALVESGADIEGAGHDHLTPLHIAAQYGASSVAEYLITSGADPERRDTIGRTPLMLACYHNSCDVIKVLANACMVHDTTDDQGNNALCALACEADLLNEPPNVEAFKILVDKGVDPFVKNNLGLCAAHYILANPSMVYLRHMLGRCPKFFADQPFIWPPNWIFSTSALGPRRLLGVSRSLQTVRPYVDFAHFLQLANISTPREHSLFCQAARWGLVEAVRNFMEIGATIDHPCHEHGAPLVAALKESQFEVVRLLVRNGAKLTPAQFLRNGVVWTEVDDNIRDWLLVGRHVDQRKLTTRAWNEDRTPTAWAGVFRAAVEVEWHWKQGRGETMLEHARNRQRLIRELRGTQVKVLRLVM